MTTFRSFAICDPNATYNKTTMSFDPTGGFRSASPPSSGRSSPVQRASRRTAEDALYKADKGIRRYGAIVERALSSWEISPQEWADYIAFLARLLKAIQSHPKDAPFLPHGGAVASKLAQCLNPALPSGVHQKALEVYSYIFSTFGLNYISGHLPEFLPGLSAVLSFASLSVRPALYSLYEDYITQLNASDLRPSLKSLILSLLPALEEETSEDFERAFAILDSLQTMFSGPNSDERKSIDRSGYFWQCLFLAVITSPTKRQGSLNYLARKLPKFMPGRYASHATNTDFIGPSPDRLTIEAETVISPEPGLLIRCFVCGLADPNILIQRGFLDLLVTNLPLSSPILQGKVGEDDLDRLVSAAMHVLLRREMSLNRRLWSWFLGPDPKEATSESQPSSPVSERKATNDSQANLRLGYFTAFGKPSLERCVLKMFKRSSGKAADIARPFRICLSLMDMWEIGGSLVPKIFLPAIRTVYTYSLTASSADVTEVVRSASLFFDGIEADLIWANLMELIRIAFEQSTVDTSSLDFFAWIMDHFNVRDEEMLTVHLPYAALYTVSFLEGPQAADIDTEKKTFGLVLVSTVLAPIPQRIFTAPMDNVRTNGVSEKPSTDPAKDARAAIEGFYTSRKQASGGSLPFTSQDVFAMLNTHVMSLAVQALAQDIPQFFSQATVILSALSSKESSSPVVQRAEVFNSIAETLRSASAASKLLPFTTLASMLALLAAYLPAETENTHERTPDFVTIEPVLIEQIWEYLSPNLPKYHVEAVRLIWQLGDLVAPSDVLEAALAGLVRQISRITATSDMDREEAARRFCILWGHTVPTQTTSTKSSSASLVRRSSAMPSISDPKLASRRLEILTEPLMLILDTLDDIRDPSCDVVKNWLRDLPTLEQVFRIHFDRMPALIDGQDIQVSLDAAEVSRHRESKARELGYILNHFLNILKHGNDWAAESLNDIVVEDGNDDSSPGVQVLAEYCVHILRSEHHQSRQLHRTAIELLGIIISGPTAILLKPLDLESSLIDQLMAWLLSGQADLQGDLLNLVTQALKLRLMNDSPDTASETRPRGSISVKRSSITNIRPSSGIPTMSTAIAPPRLLELLRLGFTSQTSRQNLHQWLTFLANILPIFADAIFSSLIPLVECFCTALTKAHGELVALSRPVAHRSRSAPESDIMALLDGLEMVLARAHECLVTERPSESAPKPIASPHNLLSSVTSGVFKSEGPPSRTAQANSRLTVVLAFQDAIKVSMKLWTWGNRSMDTDDFDKNSAATTSFNALKVRNRTRHLLEQIFAVEPLETLEVVMARWCHATNPTDSSAAMDLLHVIKGSRPKIIVPAVLDSLCSRTNPSALSALRQSSQTVELTATDVAHFLSEYIQSIEDDAMDEVWADCIAFFRDVLANPLPQRQVLPALLSVILLLAQKVENTSFGEQRRMRRDLGDIFLRLMTATFTTMPSIHGLEAGDAGSRTSKEGESKSATAKRTMSLLAILIRVVSNIEAILETTDRIITAINTISTSLIAPLFHAKSFPANITLDVLILVSELATKAPTARTWKKEVLDAFNDPRLLASPVDLMQNGWFPVLYRLGLHDKERMPELLSRLAPPSSAGIMFGVGANAARLEADRRTQLNLRRICVLLLCSPEDTFIRQIRTMEEKLFELFDANASSSPSSAVKAELFLLCRAVVLSTSAVQLSPMWPVLNDNLRSALASMLPNAANENAFGNLALLQACKLLDLLVALSPDEFQLHEWLYICDTIDAVYQPTNWRASDLSEQIVDALGSDGVEDGGDLVPTPTITATSSGTRRLMLGEDVMRLKGDFKAMTRDDFARTVIRPFLTQLSMHAYEGVYSMDSPDLSLCRRNLLEDILDMATIVE